MFPRGQQLLVQILLFTLTEDKCVAFDLADELGRGGTFRHSLYLQSFRYCSSVWTETPSAFAGINRSSKHFAGSVASGRLAFGSTRCPAPSCNTFAVRVSLRDVLF